MSSILVILDLYSLLDDYRHNDIYSRLFTKYSLKELIELFLRTEDNHIEVGIREIKKYTGDDIDEVQLEMFFDIILFNLQEYLLNVINDVNVVNEAKFIKWVGFSSIILKWEPAGE